MKRKIKPDLLSAPGEKCPRVSNDHPPICQQPSVTSCLDCPNYTDGLCDLIPWDEEKMTEAQKTLLMLYKVRDKLYDDVGVVHKKIDTISDAIQVQLKIVRREQGRK